MSNKRVLILSHDKIGKNMAGPGIRYHYMAELLSKTLDVTVGFFNESFLPDSDFEKKYKTKFIQGEKFQKDFANFDVVIAMWLDEAMVKYCHSHNIFLVFDVYAPVPVENLTLFLFNGQPITDTVDYDYRQSYNLYEKYFEYGDLFLFSNQRQLNFWMGYVFGTGIIKVSSYAKRPVFDRFIYAPMGIDTKKKISHEKNVIRNTIPGIGSDDKVLLWTGGIWNWFDAQILIRAMKTINKKRPDIKLVFFGIKHPNPNIPAMQEATDTIKLARELKLLDKTVFVHEGWVPYDERINYLLEADAAVNTTKESIESEVSHRTRVLDHILTSLPTVSTAGDYLSDDVIKPGKLGITVSPDDVEELSEALMSIVEADTNKSIRKRVSDTKEEYDWEMVLSPLVKALTGNIEKLPFIETKKIREIPKTSKVHRIAKKILPKSVKKIIVKVFRYGR